MADYAAKPTKAKQDVGVIDQRKRMLAVFLNRCRKMKDVLEDGVYWRFLDPNSSWVWYTRSRWVSIMANRVLERGATCSARLVGTQEQSQGTSSRSSKSYTRTPMATRARQLCQIEVVRQHFRQWDAN